MAVDARYRDKDGEISRKQRICKRLCQRREVERRPREVYLTEADLNS
jgi:hypothetical protein